MIEWFIGHTGLRPETKSGSVEETHKEMMVAQDFCTAVDKIQNKKFFILYHIWGNKTDLMENVDSCSKVQSLLLFLTIVYVSVF